MIRLLALIPVLVMLLLPQGTYKAYLPLVTYSRIRRVGVESERNWTYTIQYINRARPLKVSLYANRMITSNGIDWTYGDNKIGILDIDHLVIKGTPEHMLFPGEPVCKLPKNEYWYDYAEFVQQAIDRYRPEYVSLYNEPDASNTNVPEVLGCLGPDGGMEYGLFFRYIYDRVEGAQMVAGNVSSVYGQFVTDMLDALDGYFDALGYHCYGGYYPGGYDNPCQTVDRYAKTLTDKPVIATEQGFIFKNWPVTPQKLETYEFYYYTFFQWADSRNRRTYIYHLCGNGWPVGMPVDLCLYPMVYDEYRQ